MSGVAVRVSGTAFRVRVAMEACSSIRVGAAATTARPAMVSRRRLRRRAARAATAGFPGDPGGDRGQQQLSIPKVVTRSRAG